MRSRFRIRLSLIVTSTITLLMLIPTAAMSAGNDEGAMTVTGVEFVGEVVVPTGETFGDTEIGGLSSITYDASRNVYYTVSDDNGFVGFAPPVPTGEPVRYYTVAIDLTDGSLDSGDVVFTGVSTIFEKNKTEFTPGLLDPEGLVLTHSGQLFMSSEGKPFANPVIDPFINRYNLQGRLTAELPIPDKYLPNGVDWGVRNNLSFESLNLTPDGHTLVTAGEAALYQDGPAATDSAGSLARILAFDIDKRRAAAEYVYEVEPWAEPSGIFGVNGIVEVLPIDNVGTTLVMERSFSVGGVLGGGTGNVVAIYETSSMGATDVLAIDALYQGGTPISFTPVSKDLLFEFDSLGIPIDNIEGMTFGPLLPDGRQSLVIVSDNNFSAFGFTQFIVLAVDIEPVG